MIDKYYKREDVSVYVYDLNRTKGRRPRRGGLYRFIPKIEGLPRVSSNNLEQAEKMALSGIAINLKRIEL